MTPVIFFLIVTSLYEIFIGWTSTMTPFIPFLILTSFYINISYSEVTMRKGMKGVIVLHPFNNYFSQWGHNEQYLLRGWSTMTPFKPFLIVTSLYEISIDWTEYDDTFHTSGRCVFTGWSIFRGDGVRWHLWEKEWKVLSYSILSITTSVSEVTMSRGMKDVIVFHPLNKYFIEWGHYNEIFIEGMEYDDTFQTFSHCDLTVWNIYWLDGVRWYLPYLWSLWLHWLKLLHPLNKYFIQWGHSEKRCERCHYIPSPQYIRHTMRSHWAQVWKVSSYSIPSINTLYSEVTMRKGRKGVIVLRWHLSYIFSL
jgi:hypothetical protein